jgi:O-Antigen ligase
MPELHADLRQSPARAVFVLGFQVTTALLLFGSYLGLSVSQVLTGSASNWILCTVVLQAAVLAFAWVLGLLRGPWPMPLLLGAIGLCLVMAGHGVAAMLDDHELTEYGTQKLWAGVFQLVPAILCGVVLGRRDPLPGARLLPVVLAPLLVLCAVALATDPKLLTIASFDRLAVYGGVLVLPAHQGLASCLAASTLMCMALCTSGNGAHRLLQLTLVSVLVGLVLLTGARGYTVALACALAVQLSFGGGRFGAVLLSAAIGLVLFDRFAPEMVQDRLQFGMALDSIAYQERESAWQTAWTAFLDSPWVGHGPGGFSRVLHFQGRAYPHNLALEVASELGVLGLGCLAAMLLPVVAAAARKWRSGARPGAVATFAVGYAVFGLVGAMTVGDLIRNHFLFLALGMAAAATMETRSAVPARVRMAVRPAESPA